MVIVYEPVTGTAEGRNGVEEGIPGLTAAIEREAKLWAESDSAALLTVETVLL